MKATIELTKKTSLEELIENKNVEAIEALISKKQKALEDAMDNAGFYLIIGSKDMADSEAARVERLTKDIERLKAAI